jgi:hypothetical protein
LIGEPAAPVVAMPAVAPAALVAPTMLDIPAVGVLRTPPDLSALEHAPSMSAAIAGRQRVALLSIRFITDVLHG